MTTDNNRPARRTRDRAKLFGLLFILFILAGIVLTRPLWEFMLPGAVTPVPPAEVAIVTPTSVRAEDATATVAATAEPLALATFIDNAALEGSAEGELLLLFGGAEPDCPIIVAIDGNELGQTQSGSDGRWTLRVLSPAPGDYSLQAICQRDGEQLASPEIPFVIPAPDASGADASGADASGADAGATPNVDASGVLTDTLDSSEEPTDIPPDAEGAGETGAGDAGGEAAGGEDAGGEAAGGEDTGGEDAGGEDTGGDAGAGDAGGEDAGETPAPAAPTFTIANDLSAYVGGPLRVIGNGTPGATVAVSVTAADGSVVDQTAATVNADGVWGVYVALPPIAGDYSVSAASGDTPATAPASVSVAGAVEFGGPGLCRGRTPPLGGFDRAALTYSIADCEYFSLVANRLGVSFAELQAANPQIANVNNIQPGTLINVPPLP